MLPWVVWSFATTASGVRSVMTSGMKQMHRLSAVSWDYYLQVQIQYT